VERLELQGVAQHRSSGRSTGEDENLASGSVARHHLEDPDRAVLVPAVGPFELDGQLVAAGSQR